MSKANYTSSSTNVTYTDPFMNWVEGWTRKIHTRGSWLGLLDTLGHRLGLPAPLMKPVCDWYDIQLGIPKADLIYMDYTHKGKPTPWWLR